MMSPTQQPELISDRQLEMALSIAELVRSQGAIPVMIRPPQLSVWEFAAAFAAKFRERCRERGPLFLDLSRPDKNADLYAGANHMDDDHLNAKGAALFSERLADQLSTEIHEATVAPAICRLD